MPYRFHFIYIPTAKIIYCFEEYFMALEQTVVLLKPDTVRRKLIGEILRRIEQKNFKILGMKFVQWDRQIAENFYCIHKGKSFYEELIEFITSGPIVALCLEGENAIHQIRKMMGATNPMDSAPGTIRGDLTLEHQYNLIHGSDSIESVSRELPIVFREEELIK